MELVITFLRYNRYQKLKYEFCFIASLEAAVLAVNLLAKYPNTQDSVQSLQVIEDVVASLLLSANKWLSDSLPNVSSVYNVTDKDFNKALEEIKVNGTVYLYFMAILCAFMKCQVCMYITNANSAYISTANSVCML